MTARRRITSSVVAMLAIGAGCTDDEIAAPVAVATAIEAPVELSAGLPFEVVIEASGGDTVVLEVSDAYVTTSHTAVVIEGRAVFELPQALTTLIGHVDLAADGVSGPLTASTEIVPRAAVDPIDVVVGPRTIVADGADQTMAVAFLADRFGNPLSDGTGTTFTRRGERGDGTDFDVELDHGLAATLITAGVDAERVDVVVRVAGDVGRDLTVVSRRVDYRQVPGRAAAVTIDVSDADIERFVADGRSVIDVSTGVIVDVFGNQLPDGHIVRLEVNEVVGFGQLTSTTIDGIARFLLQTPNEPGPVSLVARVDDVVSDEFVVSASPAVSEIPTSVSQRSDRTIVQLGPVLDHDGAIVADGTVATVQLDDDERRVQLAAGRAVAEFEGGEVSDSVSVTVLGVSITVESR